MGNYHITITLQRNENKKKLLPHRYQQINTPKSHFKSSCSNIFWIYFERHVMGVVLTCQICHVKPYSFVVNSAVTGEQTF